MWQDTEAEAYVNTAEPWKQGIGGLVAPRTFAARFFVTRCSVLIIVVVLEVSHRFCRDVM